MLLSCWRVMQRAFFSAHFLGWGPVMVTFRHSLVLIKAVCLCAFANHANVSKALWAASVVRMLQDCLGRRLW